METEVDLELPNWAGYDYPLACRMLKQTDAFYLYPVMKKSALNLSSFIEWGKYAPGWNYKQVTRFVRDHVKRTLYSKSERNPRCFRIFLLLNI